MLEVLYHRAKFGGARISPTPAAKSVECFVTGSITCSAKRWYLSYSQGDFEVFRPAGVTRATDEI